jgi:hypothetical protein
MPYMHDHETPCMTGSDPTGPRSGRAAGYVHTQLNVSHFDTTLRPFALPTTGIPIYSEEILRPGFPFSAPFAGARDAREPRG